MKNYNSSRYRSLLKRGARALAMTSVLLAIMTSCGHGGTDTDNSSSKSEVTTTCITSTTTSTSTTSTTSSTTTSTSTTTTVVTTTEPVTEKIAGENIVQTEPVYVEPVTEYIEPSPQTEPAQIYSGLPITEYERVLLCNVVANEYGSDWVSVYDKAMVVACVMNRVNSPQFPNTIEGVLTQPYQFSGYWASSSYYPTVTDSCIAAVDYYFAHTDEFGSYLYFEGDGYRNCFH